MKRLLTDEMIIILVESRILPRMTDRERRWSELAHDAFARTGQRSGAARRAVVEVLSQHDCCLSAQEIASELRAGGAGVGVASVYRALDLLHGEGLVNRIEVGEGGARYERLIPAGEHHHHLVCDGCGEITPFEDEGLERAINRLADKLDEQVTGHEVLLRGQCSRCETSAAG
jgi:Fur family ferric uptake transcriptional regulator